MHNRKQWMIWLAPWVWMGVIFYLSSQSTLPSAPEPWLDLLLKKGAHMVVYAILAFLWERALRSGGMSTSRARMVAFVLTVVYAGLDEYHQHFVPGRTSRLWDVLIDALGAALMLLRPR